VQDGKASERVADLVVGLMKESHGKIITTR